MTTPEPGRAAVPTFFRLLETDPAGAASHPDAFDRLRRGELHGVLVRDVYPAGVLEEVVGRLEGHDPPFLKTWFPREFRSFFYGRNLNLAPPTWRATSARRPSSTRTSVRCSPMGSGWSTAWPGCSRRSAAAVRSRRLRAAGSSPATCSRPPARTWRGGTSRRTATPSRRSAPRTGTCGRSSSPRVEACLGEGYGLWPDPWAEEGNPPELARALGLACTRAVDATAQTRPSHRFTVPGHLDLHQDPGDPVLKAGLMLKWRHENGRLRCVYLRFEKPA